jgi:hypothetical protein
MDFEETVFTLVEPRHFIKFRSFRQSSSGIVTPSVVSATKHERRPKGFLGHAVCSVSTHVVKGAHHTVLSEDQEERESREFIRDIVAGLAKAAAMTDTKPCLEGSVYATAATPSVLPC